MWLLDLHPLQVRGVLSNWTFFLFEKPPWWMSSGESYLFGDVICAVYELDENKILSTISQFTETFQLRFSECHSRLTWKVVKTAPHFDYDNTELFCTFIIIKRLFSKQIYRQRDIEDSSWVVIHFVIKFRNRDSVLFLSFVWKMFYDRMTKIFFSENMAHLFSAKPEPEGDSVDPLSTEPQEYLSDLDEEDVMHKPGPKTNKYGLIRIVVESLGIKEGLELMSNLKKVPSSTYGYLWHCTICGYQIKKRQYAEEHMMWKHAPYRPRACPDCSKIFKHKLALKKHFKHKHGKHLK